MNYSQLAITRATEVFTMLNTLRPQMTAAMTVVNEELAKEKPDVVRIIDEIAPLTRDILGYAEGLRVSMMEGQEDDFLGFIDLTDDARGKDRSEFPEEIRAIAEDWFAFKAGLEEEGVKKYGPDFLMSMLASHEGAVELFMTKVGMDTMMGGVQLSKEDIEALEAAMKEALGQFTPEQLAEMPAPPTIQ